MAEGGENIEMDPIDPETRTTSTRHGDSRLPPPIPSRHSEFDGDRDLPNADLRWDLSFVTPLNSRSDRHIYLVGETTTKMGEEAIIFLFEKYPDAGYNRPEHEAVELGIVQTGTATGRIVVRLFGKDVEFTPILNKDKSINKRISGALKKLLEQTEMKL